MKAARRALQDSGLTMTGWHVEWRDLQEKRYGDTVRYLQQMGCSTAIIPCLGGKWQVAHGPSEEVVMEFDSGNCIEGGADPVEILSAYPKRDVILHLKPYSPEAGFDVVLGSDEDANEWNRILTCRDYLWYLVESENTLLPEMENADLCLQALRKYLQ